jgi:enoyl-CoA hydratase/carnithine racemase
VSQDGAVAANRLRRHARTRIDPPRPDVTVITPNRPEKLNALNHELVDDPLAIAETLCGYGKFGVESTKQVLWVNLEASGIEAALHVENRSQILASTSGEMAEAAAAFATRKNK